MIKLITINNITITITNNSIINKSQLLRTRKKKEKRGPKILTEILNPPKKQLHKWNAEYDIEIEKIILYIAGMLFIYLFIYLLIRSQQTQRHIQAVFDTVIGAQIWHPKNCFSYLFFNAFVITLSI